MNCYEEICTSTYLKTENICTYQTQTSCHTEVKFPLDRTLKAWSTNKALTWVLIFPFILCKLCIVFWPLENPEAAFNLFAKLDKVLSDTHPSHCVRNILVPHTENRFIFREQLLSTEMLLSSHKAVSPFCLMTLIFV